MGVRPEIFKSVEITLFLGHQVYKHARVIHDDPATIGWTLTANVAQPGMIPEILSDCVCSGPQLSNIVDGCDDEKIGNWREVLNIQHNDVSRELL
jgi:hypothetical protein